jgi:hypothetical protein
MYYDSTLYKSIFETGYILKKNNTIFEFQKEPYSLFLSSDTIFIRFKYAYKDTDTILPYYPTKKGDTIKSLFDKSYLNYKSKSQWLSRKGRNSFVCDTVIIIGSVNYNCYLIKFEEATMAADKLSDETKLIYVDKISLLPVKTEVRYFRTQTTIPQPFFTITYLDSSSNANNIGDSTEERLIWEDTSTVWNIKQKAQFKKSCLEYGDEVTCDCIINELSSKTNYFKLQIPNSHSYYRYLYIKAIEHCTTK